MKSVFLSFLFQISFSNVALSTDFNYGDLVNLIQQKKISSVEKLLPELPSDLRSNYSILHESRSLQEATFEQPRIILFGKNATLTCAFNGEPTQVGFDTLECFQFLKETRSFDFRQIQFPTEQNKLSEVQFSKSGLSVNQQISCSSCHTQDARPNWDSYSTWPGAYGENDDSIDDTDGHYANFIRNAPQHPRYKWLISNADSLGQYSQRPNLRFSDFTNRMNAYRAARIFERKLTEWQTLGYAISALKCELSPDQIKKMDEAGLNYESDINLTTLFHKINLSSNELSTQIMTDPNKDADYEHQGGFGYLTVDTAMAIISRRADLGDKEFIFGIRQLMSYVSTKPDSDGFYANLYAILPDPDYFSLSYRENVGLFCPRLTSLFTESYLQSSHKSF